MPQDPFLYRDWLHSFRREVEQEMERMRQAPAKPPEPAPRAPAAAEGLKRWFDAELEDPAAPAESLTTIQIDRELELSRREIAALKLELAQARSGDPHFPAVQEQVRALGEERARLEEQLRAARHEAALLRDLKANLEEQVGSLRLRLAGVRGEYEAKLKLRQDEADAAVQRLAASAMELRNERERREDAERRLQELRARVIDAEALRAEVEALRGEVRAAAPAPPADPPR